MREYRVKIPEENYRIIEFMQEERLGIAEVNSNLKDFEAKEVFAWHCSIMVQLENCIGSGMPSSKEIEIIDKFSDFLDNKIKGIDKIKPNALFLALITWNETRELIWRIYNPEFTNNFLKKIINSKRTPRKFDFRIDSDKEWKLAEWHLSNC